MKILKLNSRLCYNRFAKINRVKSYTVYPALNLLCSKTAAGCSTLQKPGLILVAMFKWCVHAWESGILHWLSLVNESHLIFQFISPIKNNKKSWSIFFYSKILDCFINCQVIAQLVKNPSAMQVTLVQFLGWKDLLEKGKATHSSILELSWWLSW